MLVDNGDLIQGNPIADYQAAVGSKEGKADPAIKALNAMKYEVGTLGNHEFNYGLSYLDNVIKQAQFPIVNANIVKPGTDEPFFQPYFIQEKTIIDANGKPQSVKSAISALYHHKLWFGIKQILKAKLKHVILSKPPKNMCQLLKRRARM
ncbi:bifunctional 2',3'-cyclic nucleotide 2'-phosphodiesterase/3'-nucleotidase periplasmic precursor protein [Actinobacillus equuli]|nr:bifunctional 2',3'-cyclic nucleotide 2'-phosphodiesterase/3'-nucleotidase periplasmic precursor protein [Actinobacillus equuli]